MIYLDNAATTKPLDTAIKAANEMMNVLYANPSSLHKFGMSASQKIEEARAIIANQLGVNKNEIIFTSGGTESNNLAISCAITTHRGIILTSKLEHKSVIEAVKNSGQNAKYINILPNGNIDLDHLENLLANKDISLISIMHVNNETGAIQPISEVNKLIKQTKSNALLHIDAVQGFCKIPIKNPSDRIPADLISIGAHKIGGLKGVGALYVKNSIKINPILHGGGQESNLRSGTENTPAIAAFGAAVLEMSSNINENYEHVSNLNNTMRKNLLENISDIHIISPNSADRTFSSPYILNVAIEGIMAEVLLHSLEMHDIYISTGSACSSNKPQTSDTLLSMGINRALIKGAIRISFSPQNTMEEVELASKTIIEEVANLRRLKF